jgi:hypothetical protein
MKQFIVDRHTTPNTPTLEQVPTEKIPVYEDMATAAADLANLAENQIIATHDTGSELSAPVDTVQSGNMHAVTSNAVAESLSYSTEEMATGGKWIDGKPIYRKVLLAELPSGTSYFDFGAVDLPNLGLIVNAQVTRRVGNGYQILNSGIVLNNGHIEIEQLYTSVASTCFLTLEYTKTTD